MTLPSLFISPSKAPMLHSSPGPPPPGPFPPTLLSASTLLLSTGGSRIRPLVGLVIHCFFFVFVFPPFVYVLTSKATSTFSSPLALAAFTRRRFVAPQMRFGLQFADCLGGLHCS